MMRLALHRSVSWLWAAVWFTLPLSLKANSISLVILGMVSIVYAFFYPPVIKRKQLLLGGLFLLFFAWHAASLLYDPAKHEVLKSLERKLSFIAIPLILLLLSAMGRDPGKWAVRGFLAGLLLSGTHMLILAMSKILSMAPWQEFTYHEFTRPYAIGAIYYSCYLSVAVYYLLFRKNEEAIERYKLPLVIFLVMLLLLSASKIFIILTIPGLIWWATRYFIPQKRVLLPIAILIIVIAGSLPFLNRLSELKNTELDLVSKEKYSYDTPFNGLTLRLVLWKLGGEILSQRNDWLTGTGIGSKQEILNADFAEKGIYTGEAGTEDRGYLDYNFHDQYVETLVGTGIPGLFILVVILLLNFFNRKGKQFWPVMVNVVLVVFFITESMLERQAGIVFFCLVWTMNYFDTYLLTDEVVANNKLSPRTGV